MTSDRSSLCGSSLSRRLCLTGAALACLPGAWAQNLPTPAGSTPLTPQDFAAVASHYGALVWATYSDTQSAAHTLREAVQAFTAQPSADRLAHARQAWRAAREFYGLTEAFRFYGGPIDDAQGLEGRINGWPMDESYVDSVAGRPQAGLVNQRRFVITARHLIAQNERGGEENIATGWHAVEFFLWGQDRSDTGPGERSFEDFVDGKAPNADRRRLYLSVVTQLLVDDLGRLVKAWAPQTPGNYRARFARGGRESVRKMLVGLGSLSRGELAGERLEVALASQDQEDEHSCFSDNTHRDVVANALGIQNVWLGRYTRAQGQVLSGPSLHSLVAQHDPALAERIRAQIAHSVQAAEAIQAPFDQEIRGDEHAPGRQRVRATITSLIQQSQDLAAAAQALGITRLTLVKP